MKTRITMISLVFLVLLCTIVFATTSTNSWEGYVYIYNDSVTVSNSSLAQKGTIVDAYVNNVWASSTTTQKTTSLGAELPPGFYSVTLECDSSVPDNITFKVWGINISGIDATAQQCAAGIVPHYGFNFTMVGQANGASCTHAQSCNGTFCVHNLCRGAVTYCGDGFCDSGETTSSCSSDCGAASAGGAGGGGGGGGAAAAVSETQSLTSIGSGGTGTFDFEKSEDLLVYQVKMTVTDDESNPKVTVKESSAPDGASLAISADQGKVYKYLSITSTVSDDKISKVIIRFKIPRSWFTDKGMDPSSTTMKKYKTGDWIDLPTRQIGQDADYYYFETESTGFSTYVITAEKAEAVEAPPEEEAPPVVEEKPPAEEEKPPAEPGPTPIARVLAVMVVLIVLLVVAYYVYTKKKLGY